MKYEKFEIVNNETTDKSIIKRDFSKVYHQQGANLNDPDQYTDFLFGQNNNDHQIGNAYLHFDIRVRNADNNNFANADVIRLINNPFAYAFKEAQLAATGGSDLEQNKYSGQLSTIMKLITSIDADSISCFDEFKKNDNENQSLN